MVFIRRGRRESLPCALARIDGTTLCFCRDAGDSLNDCRIMFVTEIYKIEEPGNADESGVACESPLKSKSPATSVAEVC